MNNLYGRRLKLNIICNPPDNVTDPAVLLSNKFALDTIVIEQNGFSPEPLRVTFNVDYPGIKEAWNYAEICIYNFEGDTETKVIASGAYVILEAGYIGTGNFGIIFSGYVFQRLFEREGVVDYKVTLNCIDGNKLFDNNFISGTLDKGYTQSALFLKTMARAQNPIPIGNTPTQLSEKPMPRAVTFCTTPTQAIREMLNFKQSGLKGMNRAFVRNGKLFIVNTEDPAVNLEITISPANGGLIGTPIQTDYGVDFTCLLNPRITVSFPNIMVKLDMTTVKQKKATIGNPGSMLDETQEYQVVGVRHVGDTRGNEWYTLVTGINQ